MRATNDQMARGLAKAEVSVRPGITYGGRAMNPFSFVGSLILLGASLAGLMVLLKVVMG